MPKHLVIVESPAKARTIERFLGSDYQVEASFGHVRDLPESAAEIPAEFKKEKWARLGVNTANNFEPIYIVPDDKRRHVAKLKEAAKGKEVILLATDEDREGESISWHVLEVLKPSKKVDVKRIVFHEITKEAIQEALRKPRAVDADLVKAQEARRILDRLYGYTLSPLLWTKVKRGLSAGRVQSVAVRLTVERERQRIAFRSAEYWDLEALLGAKGTEFKATLERIDGKGIASGKSFDAETGQLKDAKAILVDRQMAENLESACRSATPWTVVEVESNPGQESPPPPFMTSTLQQESNRKLRMSSKACMQIAQKLYEGVDLDGERVGLITYMRTDSLTLAERALTEAREVIQQLYGKEYLPDKPKRYTTKSKNAQEAHEAIRPTDLSRRPDDIKKFLSKEEFALYDLIWKRTIASQMLPARVLRTQAKIAVDASGKNLWFGASGKVIEFPGFLRAYVEGSDDPEAELGERETVLPPLAKGQVVDLKSVGAKEHHTRPPARYTEASLIKKLEEEGIGRPSTYASIISTIQDRGYVFKAGNELIPTFTAFAVTELLENNFGELVDLKFTARMEDELDEISNGDRDSVAYLKDFYLGQDSPGLEKMIEERKKEIPFPAISVPGQNGSPERIVVRIGKNGPFIQRGEGGTGNTASVPESIPPAELTYDRALELLSGPEALGREPSSGRCVFLKRGRFGTYLELDQTPEEREAKTAPRRAALPKDLKPEALSEEDLKLLFSLPRKFGEIDGKPLTGDIGRYGPYLKWGDEFRNVDSWRSLATMPLAEAEAIVRSPKEAKRARTPGAPKTAIKDFGVLDGLAGPVKVLNGFYGPYVTDGKINATIPKSIDPNELTADQAIELIKAKAAAPPRPKRRFAKKK
ncbi:MAG: DNA topoisomerase 1 [Fimbriimonadaceae bacterium]|nr:DNA topoisomerase 1 [Fimbriimonadaceae bacterium]